MADWIDKNATICKGCDLAKVTMSFLLTIKTLETKVPSFGKVYGPAKKRERRSLDEDGDEEDGGAEQTDGICMQKIPADWRHTTEGATGRRGERAMRATQAPKSVTMPTRNKKRRGVSDDASWMEGGREGRMTVL